MAMFAASLMFLTALMSLKPANKICVNRVSNPIIQHGIGKNQNREFYDAFHFSVFHFHLLFNVSFMSEYRLVGCHY